MPRGDGVVDVQEFIVLAEHLFEEFPLTILGKQVDRRLILSYSVIVRLSRAQ